MHLALFVAALAIGLGLKASPGFAGQFQNLLAPLRIADLLFPETTAWQTPDELPALGRDDLTSELAETLRLAAPFPGPCSETEELLGQVDAASRIHRFGIDQADDGLIYSDNSSCGEGDVTIVWRRVEKRIFTSIHFPARVLKLRGGGRPRFTAVEVGCCANPIDQYHVYEWLRGSGIRHVTDVASAKMLEIPESAVLERQTLNFEGEVTLRISPELSDAWDPEQSEVEGTAIFGNIARKYLPGIAASEILAYRDPAGRSWALVLVPQWWNARAYYNGFVVNVGWVQR